MKLTGRVVQLESGKSYVDGTPRAHIELDNGGESFETFRIVRIPNKEHLNIDDEVELTIQLVHKPLARAAS